MEPDQIDMMGEVELRRELRNLIARVEQNSALSAGLCGIKKKSPWQIDRKIEYTEKGIRRLKCIRCGRGAQCQWSICADGNNYRPICLDCDIALNRVVLKFMRHPHANQKADEYEVSKHNT
jgi:hypothetical protein